MAQWNKNTVPNCDVRKCSDEVLATVEHIGCDGKLYRRVIKVVYFPYHHCTVEDMGWNMCDGIPDDWEYCEEQDTYWIRKVGMKCAITLRTIPIQKLQTRLLRG